MAIKRYIPKYKILAKLRYALWLEKRRKINQFARQKWDGKKNYTSLEKLKFLIKILPHTLLVLTLRVIELLD